MLSHLGMVTNPSAALHCLPTPQSFTPSPFLPGGAGGSQSPTAAECCCVPAVRDGDMGGLVSGGKVGMQSRPRDAQSQPWGLAQRGVPSNGIKGLRDPRAGGARPPGGAFPSLIPCRPFFIPLQG